MKHCCNKQLIFLLLILLIAASASSSFVTSAFAEAKKNILILNSYHQDYKWTNDETRGVVEALAPVNDKIKIYIEYMGTKWVSGDQYFEELNRMLKFKYQNIRFDVIVLSDNDALNFLVKYRDGIFDRVPTVFCGINYFQDDDLKGQPLYTGTNETADIKTNLETILRLHPATKKIVVINDTTTTGKRIKTELMKVIPVFQDRVRFEFLEDIEMEKLLEKIKNLPPDNVVFYTLFFLDKTGRFYEYDESIQLISQRAKVPVYGTWDFSLGHGIIGGMLTSGYDQGKSAGEMALRILKGEKIGNIPVVRKSPNRYMFDYQQMKRFGIKPSALPPDSVIINKPVSFYAVHKSLVWGTLAGIIGLIFVVIVLLFNIRQRKKAQKALREAHDELENRVRERTSELVDSNNQLVNEIAERKQAEALLKESEEKYHKFFSTSRDCVFITSKDGNWIDLNEAAVEIFGYSSREELMQMKIPDLYVNPEERAKHLIIITKQGYTKEFPVDLCRKDGMVIHTLITSAARYDAEGNLIGFQGTIRDITERKKAEEALLESELKFKSFAEYAIIGTYISQDGVLKYVNPKFAQMFGYTVEECLNNMPFETLVSSEDIAYVKEQIRKRTAGEIEFIHYSFRGLKKNGQVFPIEIYGSSSVHMGKPAAAGTLLDITDRKQAEEERLRGEKLQGVLEMAGTVCHEMNQPMQIISGYSEMLLNASNDHPIYAKLHKINEQIQRMGDITKKLMNIKNFESQDYAGFGRIININKCSGNDNK
ncbi:MAG: ABC transporter substrate binding protein [Smithellaceae bacterium]